MPQSHSPALLVRLSRGVRRVIYAVASALAWTLASSCGSGNDAGSAFPSTGPTISPPQLVSSPTSVSVAAGQSAAFSVQVAGTPPFAYQWFRNGQPMEGAAASTYAIPVVQRADSGATFYAAVSNFGGAVQSGTATLTVVGPPR